MLRLFSHRSAPDVDDEQRVERFVWPLVLAGVALLASGILYVSWYVLGSRW